LITNTTITKMTAVEFTREYFKKHSNVELLEKGLVGTDYWYEVMEAYAKHENAKLKELLQKALNMHPDFENENKEGFVEGGYELLMEIKQALK